MLNIINLLNLDQNLNKNTKFYNIVINKLLDNYKLINEQFEDNIEYKWRLDSKNNIGIKKLITQMLWRLNEGKERYGIHEAHYILGIYDSGEEGKLNLEDLNKTIDVFINVVNKANCYILEYQYFKLNESFLYYAYIRKTPDDKLLNHKYLIMIGDSGVGKTSLLASLCNEIKDNGNGFSRNYMLKHKHEKVNGLSHTFKKEILGLNNNILNYFNSSYDEIYSSNSIIVNLFDTAGSSSKRSNMLYILSSIITDMLFLVKKDDKNDKNHVFNNLFNIYSKYFNINNDMKLIINISDKSNDDFNFNSTNNIYFSNITHNNLDKIYSKIMLLNNINNNNHNNCILDSCFRILDKYDINNNTNTNNIIVSGIQCIGHLTTNTNVYIYIF